MDEDAHTSPVVGYWQADFKAETLLIAGDATARLGVNAFEPLAFDYLREHWQLEPVAGMRDWLLGERAAQVCSRKQDPNRVVFRFLKSCNDPFAPASQSLANGEIRSSAVTSDRLGSVNPSLNALAPQILDGLPDPVFVYQIEKGCVFLNDAAVPLLSEIPDTSAGTIDLAMPKGFRRMMLHMLERVEASGKPSRIEFYAKHRQHGLRWWSGLWSPLLAADGRLNGIFILHRDVSEQTEMQGQLLRERKKLHRLATTDPLTRLSNRRNFLASFASIVSVEAKHNRHLSVLLFDIDHFKAVNDTHGHAAGDAVLRAVAEVARQQIRSHDLVARWGGEEFIVCLPDADLAEATIVGERVRLAIEALKVEAGGQTLNVTASFGVQSLLAAEIVSSTERDAMFAAADAALYAAKRLGRNRLETTQAA